MTVQPPPSRFGIPALARSIERHLDDPQDDRFWRTLALAIGAVASVAFIVSALRWPGGVQSDARQFLSWMGRWDDPGPLAGDLMADFWRSASPWVFTAVYRAAWFLGVPPLVFAKLLPIPLFPAAAWFAYRFLRGIGAEASAAFAGASLAVCYLAVSDTLASATPRCFWPVLLLALLDGLTRRSVLATALPQLLIAGSYPQMALVTSGLIALSAIDPERRRLDLSARRLVLIGAAAAATLAALAPFALQTQAFGPAFTLAEARTVPAFLPHGRSSVIDEGGSINLLCGRRMGLFDCNKGSMALFLPSLAVALLGPLILFRRSTAPGAPGGAGRAERLRTPLPLYLAVSSLLGFAASALLLFRLHLPNRYSGSLVLVGLLVTAPLMTEWAGRRLARRITARGGAHTVIRFALLLLPLTVAASVVHPRFLRPLHPDMIRAIGRLPEEAVVAGFDLDLDFSPVLTNRSTLFSLHLAIAYEKGYYTAINARLRDMRDAVLTLDPAVLAERLSRNRVALLILPTSILREPKVPRKFRAFFGPEIKRMEAEAAAKGPTALARAAAGCRVGTFPPLMALDGPCLVGAATGRSVPPHPLPVLPEG